MSWINFFFFILIKISECYWRNKKLKIIQGKNKYEDDRCHIVQVSEHGCMNKRETNRIASFADSI